MPRSVCQSLFVACSLVVLSGCLGPRVNWLIVDPTGFADKKGVVTEFTNPITAGVSCISPDDTYRVIKACKEGHGVEGVHVCDWTPERRLFACSSGDIVPPEDRINWACLSARDWNRFLTYCQRKDQPRSAASGDAEQQSVE